jgi:hypothetical protein
MIFRRKKSLDKKVLILKKKVKVKVCEKEV